MKTAVDKVKKGKGRVVNARFAAMCAHYLFDADFCNVAAGWEKGVVEKNVQDSRRRIWIDAGKQRFGSFAEVNAWLGARCRALWEEIAHPEHEQFSVAEMLEHERAHLMPMPGRSTATSRSRHGYRDLPGVGGAQPLLGAVRAGRAEVSTRLYPGRVVVVANDSIVARHERLNNEGQTRYDWRHYIPLLQTQAWGPAQRRAVRRPAGAAAAVAPSAAAQPGRRPRDGAGAGDRAHRRTGRGAGGGRAGAGDRTARGGSALSMWSTC